MSQRLVGVLNTLYGKLLLPFVRGSCTYLIYGSSYLKSYCNKATMIVSRIEDLLDVQMRLDDNLPQCFRPKCKYRLERGTENLRDFRTQVHTSYERLFAMHIGPLKRTSYELGQP